MYKIVFITNDICAFVNEGAMNQTHWRWTHSVKVSVEPPLDKVKPNVTLGAGGSVKCFPIQISVLTLRSLGTCKSGVCVWWPAWMPVCAGMKRWTLQIKLAGKSSEFYWETLPQRVVEEQWSMIPKIKLRSPQAQLHMCT